MAKARKEQPKIIPIDSMEILTMDHVPVYRRPRKTADQPKVDQGKAEDQKVADQGSAVVSVAVDQGKAEDQKVADQGSAVVSVAKDQRKPKIQKGKNQGSATCELAPHLPRLIPSFLAGRVRLK